MVMQFKKESIADFREVKDFLKSNKCKLFCALALSTAYMLCGAHS